MDFLAELRVVVEKMGGFRAVQNGAHVPSLPLTLWLRQTIDLPETVGPVTSGNHGHAVPASENGLELAMT